MKEKIILWLAKLFRVNVCFPPEVKMGEDSKARGGDVETVEASIEITLMQLAEIDRDKNLKRAFKEQLLFGLMASISDDVEYSCVERKELPSAQIKARLLIVKPYKNETNN